MSVPIPIQEISPGELDEKLRAPDTALVLLDCREPDEVALCRIAGAIHIPMGDIPTRLPHLDPDRETVVYCHTGQRSFHVAAFLQQQGFVDVKSLRGGIDAWSVEFDPRVPRY